MSEQHSDKPKRVDRRIKESHCPDCGMATNVGEFHPHGFCIWKKAGQDPWELLKWINSSLGIDVKHWPSQPPLVRDLRPHV